MPEYIDRALAKEKHCNLCKECYVCYRGKDCPERKSFDEIPAADVIDLPLKVGQTVWYVPPVRFTWVEHRTYECQVVSLTITQNKKGKWTKKFRCSVVENGKTTYDTHDWSFDEIGNVIFLTRDDAEDYLKRRLTSDDGNYECGRH